MGIFPRRRIRVFKPVLEEWAEVREIYLDNSATTKPYPEVTQKVVQMLTEKFGNPSSIYRLGIESRYEIQTAREKVAEALSVSADEIYFTSGGTESDNLAIIGACKMNAVQGRHIVTTVAEHAAVTKTIRHLKQQGWTVDYIPAPGGELDLAAMENAVTEQTTLVSVMLVNNETGCIFPVGLVKDIIRRKNPAALLHCDAVQGFGKVPFTAASIGADLISVSAHKIHGVKGAGALFVKSGAKILPLMFGGGQEKGVRSGTESTPLIAAFGKAVDITFGNLARDMAHMASLRDYCIAKINDCLPTAVIHSNAKGAPHIINLSLPGTKNEAVVRHLDAKGIFIASGAACKSNYSRGPSILESLGISRQSAESALRISFSPLNRQDEVDALINAIVDYIRYLSQDDSPTAANSNQTAGF